MDKPTLIRFIENRFGYKPPAEPVCRSPEPERHGMVDGASIVVIGGGIAGPAFARRVISLAVELGVRMKVTLISRPSCNYCGGLVTHLSLQTMRGLYGYEPEPEVVLSEIDEKVLVNPYGSAAVLFESPLASVFRTNRFGQIGLDHSFRESILAGLPNAAGEMLSVIEPAVALSVQLPAEGMRGVVRYQHTGGVDEIEADLIVVSSGLRSIQSHLISELSQLTGYKPPPLMTACVTEVDISNATSSAIGRRMLVLSGIVKDSVIALIPKQLNWITVAALNTVLSIDDLHRVFQHPAVREYVSLDDGIVHLPCNKICTSAVFTGPARNFYGDGWVALGDLTGYGRVLKDGYFAALLGADLAAHTAVMHGCSRKAFAEHYHAGLMRFKSVNRAGMGLFALNNALSGSGAFNRAMIDALSTESKRQPYGGPTHAAFRALSTGELSYLWIGLLFLAGLVSWAARHPIRAISVWLNRSAYRNQQPPNA